MLTGPQAQPFENIYALPGCTNGSTYGVRPTYVITYPSPAIRARAKSCAVPALRGTCEIGAHHHAWETPPCAPEDVARHAYASSLPIEQFEAQLATLSNAIARATGERPLTYRSGRFGFAAAHVAVLEREGYLVESSVTPLFYEAHKGGPDFVDAPLRPYFLSYDSAVQPGSSAVLEVPCSAALHRDVPATLAAPVRSAAVPVPIEAGAAKARDREGALDQAIVLVARGHEVACTAPGPSRRARAEHAVPLQRSDRQGGSPYNRTEAALDAFFDRLERFLVHAVRELGARPLTYREFRDEWIRT